MPAPGQNGAKRSRWTPEQMYLLRAGFATVLPIKDLTAQIGRSENAVRGMAAKLGLHRTSKHPRRDHQWTDDERDFVRARYQGTMKSAALLARDLGVGICAVRGLVRVLGITRRKDRKPWTPEEDEQLRDLLETYAVPTVANKLSRSENSVAVRAKRLGIRRRVHSGWYTKAEVCEILGEEHRWVQARIDAGKLRASYHDRRRPGQLGTARWHIKERDLREYLIRYPEDPLGRNVDLVQIIDIVLNGHSNGKKGGN